MFEALLSLVFPRACIGCDLDDVLLCEECARRGGRSDSILLDGLEIRSAMTYAGALRSAITAFKHGRRALGGDLAAVLVPCVGPEMTLVPIPTTRRRRAERGFDQTFVLARILARRCGTHIAPLLARRGSGAQQGRSRAERLAATGRFRINPRPGASCGRLFLFDDVRTTGATLVDAARTLDAAGIEVAGALTLAWTAQDSTQRENQ